MKVVIIGGGLGGLSAAVSLAKHGVDVKLFEQNKHFGGKMMPVDQQGYHFDFGPNTITMPEVFEEVVRQGGLNPAEELPFIQIKNHTRNQFSDGSSIDFSSDPFYMKQQLAYMDSKGAAAYDQFSAEVERLFELSQQNFLYRSFSGWRDYLSPTLAKNMLKVRPFQSLDQFFKRYFNNPNIIQALNRYATYVGSSPYSVPATFAMIAHLELNQGVFYVKGGNTKIASSFVKAAENQGAQLFNETRVTNIAIEGGRAAGVTTSSGEYHEADYVILNGDLLHALPELVHETYRHKFSNKKAASFDPSISAFVILAGLDNRLEHLHHHHLFFTEDYFKEFESLKRGEYPDDPTIYIGTSAKTDPSVSPNGDNCLILVNAPALRDDRSSDSSEYKEIIYEKLQRASIPVKDHIQMEKVFTPATIQDKFGAYKGSLYGPSSNNKIQAFARPFNRSQDIGNLYFCGGSTHPGGGSPMVVISGQNVANDILGILVDRK